MDIDSINDIYNVGGEHGLRGDNVEEREKEFLKELEFIAKNCVKFMGKLKYLDGEKDANDEDDYFLYNMPVK